MIDNINLLTNNRKLETGDETFELDVRSLIKYSKIFEVLALNNINLLLLNQI